MVLFPGELKVARSLQKALRNRTYEVRADTAFGAVMQGCSERRERESNATSSASTWITAEMIEAYTALHRQGLAHSMEIWMEAQLVGGLYGVALGKVFFGESMFSAARDASKIALAHLARQLARWGFGMIDCQMETPHLASLGARAIPRTEFIQQLRGMAGAPTIGGIWHLDRDLSEGCASACRPAI